MQMIASLANLEQIKADLVITTAEQAGHAQGVKLLTHWRAATSKLNKRLT